MAAAPTQSRWKARVSPSTSADLAMTLAAPHMTTATVAPAVPAASRDAAGDGSAGGGSARTSGEGDALVEGRALLERPTERVDDFTEGVLVHALAVRRTGGAGDVLVHEGAAEVVGARLQDLAGTRCPDLHPGHLHVLDPRVVGDAAHGMHEQVLAERGPAPRLALQVDRRRHVHEGEGHELGEASRLLLEGPGANHVSGPVHGPLHGAEHDRDVRAQ